MFPVRGHGAGLSRREEGVRRVCQAGWDGMRGPLKGTAGCNDRQAARGTFGSIRAAQGKGGCCPEPGTGRILRNPLPRPVATWPHCSGPTADQGLGALVTVTTTSTQLNW